MSNELVAIATYDNVPLAEIARLRLEEEGIPVHLDNAEVVTALWYAGNAVGYVKLMVPEEYAPRARELLQGVEDMASGDGPDGRHADADACLSCGAPMEEDETNCRSCGWSFSDSPDIAEPRQSDQTAEPDDDGSGSGSHVQGWRRIAIQVWLCIIIGSFLAGILGCVFSMLLD